LHGSSAGRAGPSEELFSLAFENGYGDDSDLYYRIVSKGLRGAIVDNMVIYHQGGGSFNLLDNVEQLRKDNFRAWSSFWMPLYQRRIHDVAARQKRMRKRYFSDPRDKKTDVLFVLPLDYRKAGGVEAVFKIVEGLREKGLSVDIYCIRHHEGADRTDFEYRSYSSAEVADVSELARHVGNPKVVISTSHDTAPYVESLKSMMRCESWHFVQGPEMAFSSGAFSAAVVRDLRAADKVLCVSEYLSDLVKVITEKAATVIPYGPDPVEFYSIGQNQTKTIAVHFAGRADKGSDLAGIAVPVLLNAGYTVEVFGEVSDYFDYDSRLKPHGYVNASALRKIFQRCSHYLDLSHYEGLGMLTLEAVFCGAIPISMRNGGSAGIIEQEKAGIILDGLTSIHRLPEIIEAKSLGIDGKASGEAVRQRANLDAAVAKFAEILEASI
jgi:glycosyltransferase involved in cell wall biosynthesis